MSVKPVAWAEKSHGKWSGYVWMDEIEAKKHIQWCNSYLGAPLANRELVQLYDASAPELAEALQRMVDNCQDCDGEGTQFYADGRTASGGAAESERPCPICTEGRQLLARITPK